MIESHILAFVGEQRAGKGTAANIYRRISEERSGNRAISRHTFSDVVREILRKKGVEFGRITAQETVMDMINREGPDALSRLMEDRIRADPNKLIIIDGIRLWSDCKMIDRFPIRHLVYVTASARIRYERAMTNSEKSDESNISFEEFCEREGHRLERDIPAIGTSIANYYIQNNGGLSELEQRMEELYEELRF